MVDIEKQFLVIIIIIIFLLVINFFLFDHCSANYMLYTLISIGIVSLIWIILPFFIKDQNYNKSEWFDHIVWFQFVVIILFFVPWIISIRFHSYHGMSIIRVAEIDSVFIASSKTGHKMGYIHYNEKRKIKRDVVHTFNCKAKSKVFVQIFFDCENGSQKTVLYGNRYHIPKIHDFAFIDDTTFYTYHEFSLIKPDMVYYQVGFNVVYKAIRKSTNESDTTANVCFTDVCGIYRTIKCKTNKYETIPDTFLVYRNVNEEIDDRFIVCAPEINTPENWSKISDYGYIFHYDIYRKEEIETQCPQIKNYVEKFKERNKQ